MQKIKLFVGYGFSNKNDMENMEVSRGRAFPYGTLKENKGVNFAIYARDPQKLSLCIFDEHNLEQPIFETELNPEENKTGYIWHAHLTGLPDAFVYAYRVQLKDQEETHLLLDPYAKNVTSDEKWHDVVNDTSKYHPLAKIAADGFDWEGDKPLNLPMHDLIIYEMHVRGYTRDPSSRVQFPGTYKGMIEKIPHLLELGVNAVELMPIFEFNEREAIQSNPETQKRLHNFFGYSTVNFFSPMNRYASSVSGNSAVNEFKELVKVLHKNGIEVILDVVFNHTAEGNEKGPVLSFKGLDPKAYYMMNNEGAFLNFSGCGNTFNCNHPVTREFIVAALRYWVLEMHVDGFRFDLASIFNRAEDGTPLENAPLVEAISKDPILSTRKLIAEAWDAGGLYQVGHFYPGVPVWSEWNGKYRDTVRNFIKGTPGHKNAFAGALSASHDLYGNGRSPASSINFVTAHDGFSLADLVSYNEKHNLENGEDNNDGMNQNDSWNCGAEGATNNRKVNNLRKKQIRNYHLALMVSQGVPMILMGDEYAHSRNGNNNTWCQDNELNWFLWSDLQDRHNLFRFYKSLIHFRRNQPLLRRANFFGANDVKWHGLQPDQPDWDNDNHFVAFTLNQPDGSPELYIAFNAAHTYQNLTIPSLEEGKAWRWVVNTNNLSPEDFFEESNVKRVEDLHFRMSPYSSIMLQKVNA
ncbi:Isoamylase 1, chloroplastic [Chlamydiales bacterium STE3]|nr:Isoamylase 1, chloroplastic [Chlamydiales bacterium STE3]